MFRIVFGAVLLLCSIAEHRPHLVWVCIAERPASPPPVSPFLLVPCFPSFARPSPGPALPPRPSLPSLLTLLPLLAPLAHPQPLCVVLTKQSFTRDGASCRHQQSALQSGYPGGPPAQGNPQTHPHYRGGQPTRPVELSSYGDGLLWGAALLLHLLNQAPWFKLADLSSLVVQRQQLEYKGTGSAPDHGLRPGCITVMYINHHRHD